MITLLFVIILSIASIGNADRLACAAEVSRLIDNKTSLSFITDEGNLYSVAVVYHATIIAYRYAEFRVAPDTDFAGYPANIFAGYPAE